MDTMSPTEKADPRYAAQHAKLQAMVDADDNADQIAGIAFKIKTYWQPQLAQEPTAEPLTVADLWKREQFFELMAGYLDDDRIRVPARGREWRRRSCAATMSGCCPSGD